MHLSEKGTTYKSSSFSHQDSNNSTKSENAIRHRAKKSRYLEVEEILSTSFLIELLRLADNKLCRIVGGRFLRVNITLTSHYLTTEKQSTSFFT